MTNRRRNHRADWHERRGPRSDGLIAEHRLDLEIFLKAEDAVLAAIAGLLVAAERYFIVRRRTIEINAAGANLLADPAGVLD